MQPKQIFCSNGKIAIVDENDFEWLSQYVWHFRKDQRVVRSIKGTDGVWTKKRMHIEIWEKHFGEVPEGKVLDHINHRPFDNRKKNLRVADRHQSVLYRRKQSAKGGKPASSQFKGVTWREDRMRWKAGISFQRKHLSLGHFVVEEDAAKAYDEALYQLYDNTGFAVYNFPGWDHTRKIFYDASTDQRLQGEPPTKSGVRGVSWNKQNEKWIAHTSTKITGERKYLGLFHTVEEASAAIAEAHDAYLRAKQEGANIKE